MSQKKSSGSKGKAHATQAKGHSQGKAQAPKGKPNGSHGKPAKKSGINPRFLVIAAVIVIGVIGVAVAAGAGKGSGGASTAQGGSPQATPEEQKYIGRLLPAGYTEPAVAGPQVYNSTYTMAPIDAKSTADGVTFAASDVTANKIVKFSATKDGQPLGMVAYVKPSGKLFVGVSFCPPCKGLGQRIESDGTLTCETCGTKRDLETGVGISGACKLYPLDELPVTVSNGTVSIAQSAIDSWSQQPLDRKIGG